MAERIVIRGTPGNDRLNGTPGDDVIDGGAGADVMTGGTGRDSYRVDNAGDQVIEAVGEGFDTIFTRISYTLAAGREIEVLGAQSQSDTNALVLVGNEFFNKLLGARGNDTLSGGGGDDRIFAAGGNDTVSGGAGNDVIYGGTGADTLNGDEGDDVFRAGGAGDVLSGGTGNDRYEVLDSGAVVIEAPGGGNDTIHASGDYTLAAGQEIETLRSDFFNRDQLVLTGNEFGNYLIGGDGVQTLNGAGGDDRLDGGAGTDTMAGGTGNDIYHVDLALDVVEESVGEGADTVYATKNYTLAAGQEIEVLRADSAAGLTLRGNGFNNYIIGGTGSDTLAGAGGNDRLKGGTGADTFAFTTALGASSFDTIVDFVSGADHIELAQSVFNALDPGALSTTAFAQAMAATTADQHILYNRTTGVVSYDADGNGSVAAVSFAMLTPGQALTAGDFKVV